MIDVRVASGAAIPFATASFDVVLSFDVFEHIHDSDQHLRDVVRVLKPGGRYLLQTPNKWTNLPFELLRHWRKYPVGPFRSYRKITAEHCALHNYWQLRRRLARHGGCDALDIQSGPLTSTVTHEFLRAGLAHAPVSGAF